MNLAAGDVLYAIGDVHGRAGLLDLLYAMIRADAAKAPPGRRKVVHLGDYVDRGEDSRAVIERVMAPPLPGFDSIALLGNHDFMMREFLTDPMQWGPGWLSPVNGGEATLASYGVEPPRGPEDFHRASYALEKALPARHRAFLNDLAHCHADGPYAFAHAGIKPGVALERQSLDDLLWIREEFLESDAEHGFVVVHGHSIVPAPVRRKNRIAIDTGAYRTGILTAVALSRDEPKFLST